MRPQQWNLPGTIVGVLLALVFFPWAGQSGEYHTGSSLVCYDCHTMHYSQQHQYDGTQGSGLPQLAGGPNAYLLRTDGLNNLCLACHDGQSFAPDVLGPNTGTHVRQAGGLNRAGTGSPYEGWKGHTLGVSAVPPGGSANQALSCQSCHQVHGSAAFRNLNGDCRANQCLTYTKDEPYAARTKTVDVWLKQWSPGDVAGNYAYDSVRFNEPNSASSRYARFCQGCHTYFHGFVGDPDTIGGSLTTGQFLRHPNAQVNIGALGGGHSSIAFYNAAKARVHVMSDANADYLASPGAGTFSVADGLTPSCFSCHKAHGNQNAFGLIFLGRNTGIVTEEGTPGVTPGEGMRNLCGQCHVQGN